MNKRLKIIFGTIAVLLSIPFIGMQISEGIDWSLLDFVVMGILLSIVGLAIEVVLRKVQRFDYRLMMIIAIILSFLLIWAELAVGIFGSPFAGD